MRLPIADVRVSAGVFDSYWKRSTNKPLIAHAHKHTTGPTGEERGSISARGRLMEDADGASKATTAGGRASWKEFGGVLIGAAGGRGGGGGGCACVCVCVRARSCGSDWMSDAEEEEEEDAALV